MESGQAERVFFEEGAVKVTNARFIAHGQTYAMSAVNSVASYRVEQSNVGFGCGFVIAVLLLLMGLGFMQSESSKPNGIALLVIGGAALAGIVVTWRARKPKYGVRLTTSSGQAEALSSTDWPLVNRIVEAINAAIVARG